jgi:hypothetical protein
VLASLEDGRARRLLARLLPRLAGGPGGARILARALRALIEGGRHQEVFDLAINQMRGVLAAKEDQLRPRHRGAVRAEGGALIGWLAGATVARRLLGDQRPSWRGWSPPTATSAPLRRLAAGGDAAPGDRPGADRPGRPGASRGGAAPDGRRWLNDLWDAAARGAGGRRGQPGGRAVALLEGAFANLGALLAEDPERRGSG